MNLLKDPAAPDPDVRLRLGAHYARPFRSTDAEALAATVRKSLPELSRWMGWAHAGYDLDAATEFLQLTLAQRAQGLAWEFGVFDAADRLCGSVGINQIDSANRIGNLGYWIATDHARQGLASRGAREAAAFGFTALGLVRLEIVAALGNLASRRAAMRAGAAFEGIARDRLLLRSIPRDCAIHALVPADLGLPEPDGSTRPQA